MASPDGLAALGLVVAVLTSALSHGISLRRRGRNAFLRETAVEAEKILSRVRILGRDVILTIDDAVDEVAAAYPGVLTSALEHATAGVFSVRDGHVIRTQGTRRTLFLLRPEAAIDWSSEKPLRDYRPPRQSRLSVTEDPTGWDPKEKLTESLGRLSECLSDEHMSRGAVRDYGTPGWWPGIDPQQVCVELLEEAVAVEGGREVDTNKPWARIG